MAAFLPIAVLLSLLVTGTTAGGYGSQTTPSTSTPASSYTPTPATPPPPPPSSYTPQPATPPKPSHDYDDNKLVAVVRVLVQGLVLCQSCAKWGLNGAVPLPKAQVMVTCRDGKHQVMAVADSNGNFHAEFTVERADDFWSKNPRGACFVRLLSSPDPKCNMANDIHLRDQGKHLIDGRGFRNVVYAAHPLAFRPRKCAPPHHH